MPIVIGGYRKLDSYTTLQLRLEQQPQPGETVTLRQSEEVQAGDAGLRVSLNVETFTRGGEGTATFSVDNSSEVETEIIMATGSGTRPSSDLRLVLKDRDGNVLSVQPVRQYTGGVIAVNNGSSVARMAPGASFTSEPINIPVPLAAPDEVTLHLEIDRFHYHEGKADHVAIEGMGNRRDVTLSDTGYYGRLTAITPKVLYAGKEPAVITGQAIDRKSGEPVANVSLTLVIGIRGFERSFTLFTDARGNFRHEYLPGKESGRYTVSVLHPKMQARPRHGGFVVQNASVSPQNLTVTIPRNYTQTISVSVSAGYETALTDVQLVLAGETAVPLPAGLSVALPDAVSIAPRGRKYLKLRFSGANTAAQQGTLRYKVVADGHTTDPTALGIVTLNYKLSQATPALVAQPSYIDTGVVLGGSVTESVILENKGLDTLLNPRIVLLSEDGSPAPAWVNLMNGTALGDMAVGARREIQVTVAPPANQTEGSYGFKLRIESDNLGLFTVPLYASVTQSGVGDAYLHVSDIYTATLNEKNQPIPGLAGAAIRLQNELVLTETYKRTTDSNGEAIFQGIPAGRYHYRASAFDHESVSGRIWIKPGVTTAEELFLINNLVKVEWEVREIAVKDRYQIKLKATYETNVPVAVVMLDPLSVNLPVMKQGDIFYGELSLTNHGLIRAENVRASLPTGNHLASFDFLSEVPDTLEAGGRVCTALPDPGATGL